MRIGNYELIWPGTVEAIPGILLFLILPAALAYSILRHSAFSVSRRVLLILPALIAPYLLALLFPLLLSLSGMFRVSSPNGEDRSQTWMEVYGTFGRYSGHVWSALSAVAVYWIYMAFRRKRLAQKKKDPTSHHSQRF